MAFEGVQPIHTEEPLIVKPDHTVANNIAQDSSGLVLFAHMAALRQKSDYEHEKMIQDNALKTEGFALAREKMGQDFVLRSEANKAKESHRDAAIRDATSAAQTITEQNQQRMDLKNKMDAASKKLKLDDVKFRTENPLQFAANVQEFDEAFGSAAKSDFPTLHPYIAGLKNIGNQLMVPVPDMTDPKGAKLKRMPAFEAFDKYNDPTTHDAMRDAFIKSGIIKADQVDTGTAKWWQAPIMQTKESYTGALAPYLDKSKPYYHEHMGNQIPLTPKVTPLKKWQSAGAATSSGPTQEEQAQDWLSKNPDHPYAAKVRAKLGLDPVDTSTSTGSVDTSSGDTGLADTGGG